jgi:hypothetical protein
MNIIGLDITDVSTTAKFKLGTIAGDIGANGPQKTYKYIQYVVGSAGAAGVVGEVAYYSFNTGYANSVVTSDISSAVGIGAGVLQAIMTQNTYGWVQISGHATLSIALTAGADGNALTAPGATDGSLDVASAVTDAICAFAADVSTKEIVCMFPE